MEFYSKGSFHFYLYFCDIVEANPSMSQERLIIGENKFKYMMPDQLKIVVNRMLSDITGTIDIPEKIDIT